MAVVLLYSNVVRKVKPLDYSKQLNKCMQMLDNSMIIMEGHFLTLTSKIVARSLV